MDNKNNGKHLILFDGVCGLCNHLNRFIMQYDNNKNFLFASIQSTIGKQKLQSFRINPNILNTLFIIQNYNSQNENLLSKSKAVLFVTKNLGFPWRLTILIEILPDYLLDRAYDIIARNRYRIFGKYESCFLPTNKDNDRFIDI